MGVLWEFVDIKDTFPKFLGYLDTRYTQGHKVASIYAPKHKKNTNIVE